MGPRVQAVDQVTSWRSRATALGKHDLVLVTLIFIALTAVLTYPLSVHPASTVLPLAGDTRLMLWMLGWDVHALTHRPWALFEANIFAPQHLTLAYSENCFGSALVAAPFLWTTRNPVLAMNAVVLISCVLCGVGTYVLARQLGLSRPASVLAGIIFAFAPPRLLRLGQLHLAPVQWVPFCLAYVHRYLERGRARDARIAAALFTLQALTSGHGALFLMVAIVSLAAWRAFRRESLRLRDLPRDLSAVGAICLVLLVLFMLPYKIVQRDEGLLRSLGEAQNWSPNLASYLASPSAVHRAVLGWLPAAAGQPKAVLFPGLLTILLASIGTWGALRDEDRRAALAFYVLLLVVSFWLTLGPQYGLYALAYRLPGANFIRVPSRYMTLALLALAVLAAVGFDRVAARLKPSRRLVVASVLGVLLAVEFNVMPLNAVTYRVDIPAADRWLAQRPRPFTVVEVPVYPPEDAGRAGSQQSHYMIHSMAHWQKTVNGYSGHEPAAHTEFFGELVNFPDDKSLAGLDYLHVDYVVVHVSYYPPGRWEPARERLTRYQSRLKLLYNDGESRIYAVTKP